MALITALTNYNQKEAKKVVYIFLIYYGFTFIIANEGVDASRYALWLKQAAELPFSDFFKIVGGLYSSETSVDIVQPLINFIVSRFTEDYNILFAIYAAIFGFFYLKSINILYNRYHENPGWNGLIHLIFFAVILPITSINGFRMWTAAWIFFYGATNVILYRDPRYFAFTLGASLVHFSFLSVNVLLIIYYFIGNRNYIYFPLVIISFILPQLIGPFLQLLSLRLGGGLQNRVEMYSSELSIQTTQQEFEQVAWFMQVGYNMVFYYILFALVVIQFRYGSIMQEKYEKNLLSFILLFLSFINFGKSIPALGSRFQIVFFMFTTFYIFLYFLKLPRKKINILTVVGIFPMALYASIILRQGAESINAWILTPGLGLPLVVPGLSVAHFLFH